MSQDDEDSKSNSNSSALKSALTGSDDELEEDSRLSANHNSDDVDFVAIDVENIDQANQRSAGVLRRRRRRDDQRKEHLSDSSGASATVSDEKSEKDAAPEKKAKKMPDNNNGKEKSPPIMRALPRIEPKTYFANERTFIQWLSSALLLVTLSLALIGFGGTARFIGWVIFSLAFLYV